jgi:hypothetical protein
MASHRHLHPKHLFFVLVGLAALFVVYKNERFILDHSDPMWAYYFPVRWLLLVHGLAGASALCLGASQFSARLRQRHVQVHRTLGRCYVISVALGVSGAGLYIRAFAAQTIDSAQRGRLNKPGLRATGSYGLGRST